MLTANVSFSKMITIFRGNIGFSRCVSAFMKEVLYEKSHNYTAHPVDAPH
jgi:hypothetical protein